MDGAVTAGLCLWDSGSSSPSAPTFLSPCCPTLLLLGLLLGLCHSPELTLHVLPWERVQSSKAELFLNGLPSLSSGALGSKC